MEPGRNKPPRRARQGATPVSGLPLNDRFVLSRRELLTALVAAAAQAAVGPGGPARAQTRDALNSEQTLLCVFGILQPAMTLEVHRFLRYLHESGVDTQVAAPELDAVEEFVHQAALGRDSFDIPFELRGHPLVIEVGRYQTAPLYSLTAAGNAVLRGDLRRLRDKTRLFLLKGPRAPILERSRGEGDNGVGGASPSDPLISTIEDVARPTRQRAAPVPRWGGLTAVFETGPVPFPRDAPLNLLSFADLDQLGRAGGLQAYQPPKAGDEARPPEERISRDGLALCLGVSRQLLVFMANSRERTKAFYTVFEIPKRTGGTRTIQSPRLFLKIIQRFVLDFLLPMPNPEESGDVHGAVHSFRRGRSIVTNAMPHRGQAYLANLDIKDFFGSIRPQNVRALFLKKSVLRDKALEAEQMNTGASQSQVLRQEVLHPDTASMLSRLCTITDDAHPQGMLPQGAPTSPMLSNLMLEPIDRHMAEICGQLGLVYTRYADDIAISGPDEHAVRLAFLIARKHLLDPPGSMQVNVKKKRVAVGQDKRQMVTGVVVNEKALPPREFRRNVRAAFDQADKDEKRLAEEAFRLRGYLSYLRSFPDFPRDLVEGYEGILARAPKR